ncbi:MAG: anti-sigma factor [Gemmatimonadota bacterium]|nr:anti-sigma factor [Gemmatimonadota bacterium]
MSDKEFERLAVLHAMGALSEEEAKRFERAREERGRGGESLVRGVERTFGPTGAGAASTVPAERADLAGITGRPLRSERPWRWIAASVLLTLALIGAVAFALRERGLHTEAEERREAATRRGDSLAALVTARDSALDARPRPAEIVPLVAASDLTTVSLSGPQGSGRVLGSDAGAILAAEGLPSLDPGGSYRLWSVGPEGPVPVASLGRAPEGRLLAIFGDAGFLAGAGALRVTAETSPEAGEPTGPLMLQGEVPAAAAP